MTEENEQRMERLFHDHYEQMYRFAFALLHDNEEARDVVSDVFSRLWDKQLVPDRAYLMRSVKNACINLIARKKRDERLKRLLPLSEEKLTGKNLLVWKSDGRLPWIASTTTWPTRLLPSSDCAIGKECRIRIRRRSWASASRQWTSISWKVCERSEKSWKVNSITMILLSEDVLTMEP